MLSRGIYPGFSLSSQFWPFMQYFGRSSYPFLPLDPEGHVIKASYFRFAVKNRYGPPNRREILPGVHQIFIIPCLGKSQQIRTYFLQK